MSVYKFFHPSDWYNFKNYVIRENRYFQDQNNYFLSALGEMVSQRKKTFLKGSVFYRARIGCQNSNQVCPLPFNIKDMGCPSSGKGKVNGRVNPVGMSYLYLATNIETAIAETKPYKGQFVSVGRFIPNKNLCLVDLTYKDTQGGLLILFSKNFSDKDIQDSVWGQIGEDFSVPILSEERETAYIPTQVVAEYFKFKGFDGVLYRSELTMSGGLNVALFDEHTVDGQEDTRLFEIDSVAVTAIPSPSYKNRNIADNSIL